MKAKIDKHKLIELAREWEAIWEARPFDNSNGLACQGAFALYYFLKEMNPAPELVVECGTWRGFSTWVIQKAVPNAKIVCSDPILASRQFLNQSVFTPEYRTREAEYTWQDFSNIDIHIPEGKRDRAVVFFDDHQNKLPRLKQAIEKGFKHIIYDDNVPYKYTHTSFEYLFNVEKDARAKKYFSRYEIFPPIYSAKHKSGVNLEGVLEKDGFYSNCFFEGKEAYSWVTKVEVTDIWPKLETRLHFDSENRVRKTLDQKHPRTKFSSIQDVMAYLENVPLKKKLANHTLPGELVVSLTSYKARFDNLHLTLRSLLLQEMWPDHIILWIAEEEKGALPPSVLELKKYGLSIRFCEDIRSYKKIVPTLREHPDSFIVTADDDIYYEPNWLKGLIESWDSEYKSVMAHRAHKIRLDEKGHPLPYKQWKWQVGPEEPADGLIVPTGCAGVLYPPGVFHKDVVDESQFMQLCSSADDIWLYWMALLNGAKAKRSTYDFILTEWPSNNSLPLWYTNINGGANDQQFSEMLKHFGKEWSNMTSLQKEACHFEYSHRKVSLILPNKNDHIQNIIKYNKTFYEVGMLEDARSRVPANGVVLDIGANIGNHSIYFGLFSDASKVFSFEPHHETFQVLKSNVDANNLSEKIICNNCGVGNKAGKARISYYNEDNIGMTTIDVSPEGTINVITVDDFLNTKNSGVDLIKIDVEGMEMEVLEGAAASINRFHPIIYVEAATLDSFKRISAFLEKYGYSFKSRFNATATYLFVPGGAENTEPNNVVGVSIS